MFMSQQDGHTSESNLWTAEAEEAAGLAGLLWALLLL